MPTLIEDQATLARLVPMLNAAVTEGQHGLPRLGVETFLSIRDKRRQELVGFEFKPTQELLYDAVFSDGDFLKRPIDRDILKSRQIYASALMAYGLFWMRCCAPLSMFCGVPVEGDEVHKQMLTYDNDAWQTLSQWVKDQLRIVRGDQYKPPPGVADGGFYWNTEQHDIVFLDDKGIYRGKSTMVYRASTIRDAGTGGNYDVQWFTDAGKFNALTETDFYVSLRRASHERTMRVWEGSPKGKIHAETGHEKYFYKIYEDMRAEPKDHERLLVIPWYLNPDYELEGLNEISMTEDESRVVGLMQRAQARFGLHDLSEDEILKKIRWRRFEIADYVRLASGAESRGLALFQQENLETPDSCWNDPSFGTFDPKMLDRLEAGIMEPIVTEARAGLTTRIWEYPRSDDYYVSFTDVAGERTDRDLTSTKVMSCRHGKVVAAIEGNAPQEEVTRRQFDLFWRYNRGLLCWEANAIGADMQNRFLALCKAADIPAARHIYRIPAKPLEDQKSRKFMERPWGWVTTRQTNEDLINHLQDDINAGSLRIPDRSLIDHLRAFDPNNKKKHKADEIVALMGANEMRRLFHSRLPVLKGAEKATYASETRERLKRQRNTPAEFAPSGGFHLMGRH